MRELGGYHLDFETLSRHSTHLMLNCKRSDEIMANSHTSSQVFFVLKYGCTGLSVVLMIWLFCTLFIRSCGGPFPQRTRGPLANYYYYKLAEFPDWEWVITQPGQELTTSEMLIQNMTVPSLQFGAEAMIAPATAPSATQ